MDENTLIFTFYVMVELFPAGCWAGWFSNQNEQRALVSHGPLRTHVTNLFVSVNLSHRQQFRILLGPLSSQ